MSDVSISEEKVRRDGYYQLSLLSENIEIPGVAEILGKLKLSFSMAIVTTSRRDDFDLIHRN